MIRLLALDIDGTILDSEGQVPEANRRAIQHAIDAGVEVVLATGRRYDFALPIVDMLPGPLTLILSNGAVVKTHEGTTLLRQLLPREVARDVLRRFPQHRAGAAVVFDRPREGQVRPFLSEVAPLEDCLTEDPIQVMFSGGCEEMRELLDGLRAFRLPEAGRAQDEPEAPYGVALTEYKHRDFSLVDVVQAGCNKGRTLRDWADRRGIPCERVMAIGDNLNDLEMLEFAGMPIVMENALAELKARGWAVTGTSDEAGVARAIETFILGGSAPVNADLSGSARTREAS